MPATPDHRIALSQLPTITKFSLDLIFTVVEEGEAEFPAWVEYLVLQRMGRVSEWVQDGHLSAVCDQPFRI